jgi:riboflavin synthase
MFTGIVEEVGHVRRQRGNGLEIEAHEVVQGTRLGDSICINGTCLTVTELGNEWFAVDTVPETLRRTDLGDLTSGDPINLERALPAGGRMGGHFVQGHVEATARIVAMDVDQEAQLVRFAVPPEIMRYIVEKGFITVDGVSLTVVSRNADSFVVTLIPFTREHTNLGSKRPGDRVNIETDIIAKYVESLLAAPARPEPVEESI